MPSREPLEVFRERIRELIEEKGGINRGGAKAVAIAADRSESEISRWASGERGISLKNLRGVADSLGVPMPWLISDEVNRQGQIRPLPSLEMKDKNFDVLPLVSEQIAAGSPVIDESDEQDHYAFRRTFLESIAGRNFKPGRLVVVRVADDHKGESMVPTIRPGALLVVDRGPSHQGWPSIEQGDMGKIYLVREPESLEGGVMVKRVFLAGDQIILWSDNPTHLPMAFTARDLDFQKVLIGKVRWIGQEIG